MTEIESKIVQLLKSDEDCNKILGLMLGRNELGVERLLSLIVRYVYRKNDKTVSELYIIDSNKDCHSYIIYHNLNNLHRFFKNGSSATTETFGEERINRFKAFLKLTIDDNI